MLPTAVPRYGPTPEITSLPATTVRNDHLGNETRMSAFGIAAEADPSHLLFPWLPHAIGSRGPLLDSPCVDNAAARLCITKRKLSADCKQSVFQPIRYTFPPSFCFFDQILESHKNLYTTAAFFYPHTHTPKHTFVVRYQHATAIMKFSYAAITAVLASVAYSQSVGDIVATLPSCSLTCLTTAIAGAGCGLTDYACQCGSAKDAITKAATPCVAAGCSTSDALKTQSVTTQICDAEAKSGSSSSASGSASSSSAEAPSTSSSATTAAPSSSSSGSFLTSATGSSIGSASSAVSSKASSASSEASSKVSSASSAASSVAASATSSAPATVSSAAANKIMAAGAVVGAGFLAAFAL
ncbi:hypothetical protein ACMFMF_006025 [Clarireedia jacksonii]